jgi:riboflavin-specific deaminase-like protein
MANSMETQRRPFVTVKYAQTLDGRIATAAGQSRWITGPEARTVAHRLRAEHTAVLVGIGTVLRDDPKLTVRLWEGPDPLRVVVDSKLRTPLDAAVLTDRPESTIIATRGDATAQKRAAIVALGARVLAVPSGEDGLNLDVLLKMLGEIGIGSVLVEGGAGIITSVIRRRLADRLVVFTAPKLVGSGLEAIGDLGIETMAEARTFAEQRVEAVGSDLMFVGSLRR